MTSKTPSALLVAILLTCFAPPVDAADTVREYTCPAVMEYELHPQFLSNYAALIWGGTPILRLDSVEVDGGQLVCHYERSFSQPDGAWYEPFSLLCYSLPCSCSDFLLLRPRDLEAAAPGWEFANQYAGGPYEWVTTVAENAGPEQDWAYNYPACEYERELSFWVNPDLHRPADGFCVVDDVGTGFRCGNTLNDLYPPQPDAGWRGLVDEVPRIGW